MSTVTTAYDGINDSCCAKVVQAIDAVNSSANVQRPVGTLAALISPQNKGTFSLQLDPNKDRPSSTSFRTVYTKDIAPVCGQDTTADGACVAPNFASTDTIGNGYVYAEHRIEKSIKREIILDVEEFKQFCTSPAQYIADRLIAFRAGVLEEINAKAADQLIAYAGKYFDQLGGGSTSISAPKAVSFLSQIASGGYAFDPTGYAKIKDEYAKLGYSYTAPIVVGGSHLGVFQTNAAFMGGSNLNGVVSTAVPNLFTDYSVDVAFADGGDHLLTWNPGHAQIVGYNDISDDMIALSLMGQRERMRITSPFGDGLTWDFFYDVDQATGCKYRLKWQLWFDVILPIPYDGTCANKPVLHFDVNCDGNTCPSNGYPSGAGGLT